MLKPGDQGLAELGPFARAKAKLLAFSFSGLTLRSLPDFDKEKPRLLTQPGF